MKSSRLLRSILTVLFLLLVYFAWGAFSKYQNDAASSELALDLTEHALTSGSAEQIISLSHADWEEQMPAAKMQRYVTRYMDRLGPLQGMTAITGSSDSPLLPVPGQAINANYVIDLQMQNQAVSAFVDLVKEDGQWWVTRFRVNAPPQES